MLYYRYKIQIFGLKKKKNEGVPLTPLNPVAYLRAAHVVSLIY